MSRDYLLGRVRSALGRKQGQVLPPPPPVWLVKAEWTMEEKLASFQQKLERLAGVVHLASSLEETRSIVEKLIAGKTAVASNAPLLAEAGITSLARVSVAGSDAAKCRELCTASDFGITSASFALAHTATLVMRASAEEPRLISLLPPIHIAVVRKQQLLVDLDELMAKVEKPMNDHSSMVFITGPSRTGDIEQILVRGVHGPGIVHVIFV
jgi:L-lactate dehydrogenase complex protein LldG